MVGRTNRKTNEVPFRESILEGEESDHHFTPREAATITSSFKTTKVRTQQVISEEGCESGMSRDRKWLAIVMYDDVDKDSG